MQTSRRRQAWSGLNMASNGLHDAWPAAASCSAAFWLFGLLAPIGLGALIFAAGMIAVQSRVDCEGKVFISSSTI
jgi:hypothetical protein